MTPNLFSQVLQAITAKARLTVARAILQVDRRIPTKELAGFLGVSLRTAANIRELVTGVPRRRGYRRPAPVVQGPLSRPQAATSGITLTDAEIKELVDAGFKVEAAIALRRQTGCDSRDALERATAIARGNGAGATH